MTDPDSSRRTARNMLIQKRYSNVGFAEHFRAVHAFFLHFMPFECCLSHFYFELFLLRCVIIWENPHFSWRKSPNSVPVKTSEGISPIDFYPGQTQNRVTRASVRQLERDTPSARGKFT